MKSYGGLLVGALGLAVLDAVVSRPQAASNVGGWLSGAGGLVKRFLDPTIPLFATTAASTTSTTGSTTATTIPAATAPRVRCRPGPPTGLSPLRLKGRPCAKPSPTGRS